MPRLTIESYVGSYDKPEGRKKSGEVVIQLPDENGAYDTDLGQITLAVLKRARDGDLTKIELDGKAIYGEGGKHIKRRSKPRTIDLANGYGGQTISRKQVLWIRP